MAFASRRWLTIIAADYAAHLESASMAADRQATRDALQILNCAPWHFRILVGMVETIASFMCWLDRACHGGRSDPARELALFEKVPVISAPLLRLYRSLVAISWFEHPDTLAGFGITETREQRQERFRLKRRETA